MNAAKPGEFDKAAFVRAVEEAIAAQAPKNLEEADGYASSGKADAVKGQVSGQVGAGKQAAGGAIDAATKAPPDTAAAKDKPVTALAPDRPPATPPTPDPAKAAPDKVPAAATDFSAGPRQVDQEMAAAGVSEAQLARSNEPEFAYALAAKKEGEEHSAAAPAKLRQSETAHRTGATEQARAAGATAMTAMTADRVRGGAAVQQGKHATKSTDEKRRADASAMLQKVFDATKADVEAILTGLDKTVDEQFTRDEKAARLAFTTEHHREMEAYKDDRYSGIRGKYRWVRDKFAGLPDEANQIFVAARAGYVARMRQVVAGIADTIGATLGRAKARIAQGRAQLQAEVAKMPKDLQAYGRKAAGEFAGRFDELTESVDAKSQELVQTLASKYTEAMKSVDDEIEADKEANKGLIAKAADAVKGVITTILALKELMLSVLSKAADAIAAILSDPIGFLGNLISAVGAGLTGFITNIGTHLKNGLVGWLLGAVAATGLELPTKFNLRGIIGMIASLLGLTWTAIRGRIVSRGVPEQVMGAVEESVPMAKKIADEGVPGIWAMIKAKFGDLKDKLLSKISEYLIPTVLMAGITWLISLLNPASAFIKAMKMIIDIVMFIVDRGAQIAEFVSSVLDAVIAIAKGGGGGVPALIEKALANSIPVLIGGLAAILGISGIADKVKTFFQSLSKPVMKAVDWVVGKLVGVGKRIWGKIKAGATRLKDKAKATVGKAKDRVLGKAKNADQHGDKQAMVRAARSRADAVLTSAHATPDSVRGALPGIRADHGLAEVSLRSGHAQNTYHVHVQAVGADTPDRSLGSASWTEQVTEATNLIGQRVLLTKFDNAVAVVARIDTKSAIPLVMCTYDFKKGRGRSQAGVGFPIDAFLRSYQSTHQLVKPHSGGSHKSKYAVEDRSAGTFILAPGYRKKWRSTFYGSSYGAFWNAWKARMLTTASGQGGLRHEQDAGKNPGQRWRYENSWYVHEAKAGGEATLDHDPTVVSHWNEQGRKTDQDERRKWFQKGPFEMMPRSENSGYGSLDETTGLRGKVDGWEIGEDFRGPGE